MVVGRMGEAGTTRGSVKAGDCELVEVGVERQLLKSSLMLEMALSWLLQQIDRVSRRAQVRI